MALWGQQEGGTAIAVLSPLRGDEPGVLPVRVHGFGCAQRLKDLVAPRGCHISPEMKMTEEKRVTPIQR